MRALQRLRRRSESSAEAGLRVLHLLTSSEMNGVNRSLLDLMANLPPRVRPVAIATEEGPFPTELRQAAVPVHVISPGPALIQKSFRWSLGRLGSAASHELLPFHLRVARLIRRERIDVIAVSCARAAVLASGPALALGTPMVAHLWEQRDLDGVARLVYERLPTSIIAGSEALRESLSSAAKRKTSTIHAGMAPPPAGDGVDWIRALAREGAVVLGALGSVQPASGCHHLVDALALLNQRGWRDRIAVVWAGALPDEHAPYQDWLFARKRLVSAGNFSLAGWHADPHPFYRSLAGVIVPTVVRESLFAGSRSMDVRGPNRLSRVHLEAMLHGLPVVATRTPGTSEILIDEQTGLVTQPSSPADMARTLERLASDEALRARLGAAGRQRAHDAFSLEEYVQKVAEVYAEAVTRVPAPATVAMSGPRLS